MRFLRKNTAVIITVGPFYDKADGVTIEGALTITNERITLTADTDDGNAPTLILDNITGATTGTANDLNYITNTDAGLMQLELTAANTNRVGRMFLTITDAANHVPVFHEFMVLDGAVYDSLVLGTDKLAVDAQEISSDATAADNAELMFDGTGYAGGTTKLDVNTATIASGAVTAAVIATGAIDADALAADTITAAKVAADVTTEIQSGLATAASIAALNNLSSAQAQTAAAAALTAYDPPTNAEMVARTLVAASYFDPATDTVTVGALGAGVITAAAIATGAIDADAIAADAVTEIQSGLALAADLSTDAEIADAVLDEVFEGTTTLRQALRIVYAVLAGKSTGGGTTTITFRDIADTKARITATVDANGNRTAVTLDAA